MTQYLGNERKTEMTQPFFTASILSGGVLSENFGRHELLETVCIKPWLLHRHSVLKRVKGKSYLQTQTQTRQIQRHIDKETDRDIKR